jgi:hypothetical protein
MAGRPRWGQLRNKYGVGPTELKDRKPSGRQTESTRREPSAAPAARRHDVGKSREPRSRRAFAYRGSDAFDTPSTALCVLPDGRIGDLCKELGVMRQTLYRFSLDPGQHSAGPMFTLRPRCRVSVSQQYTAGY